MASKYDLVTIKTDGPAQRLASVTPSAATVVNCRALYVGTTGNVAIMAFGDTVAVTLTSVPAGALLPIACGKIMSTNTTASNIVALF